MQSFRTIWTKLRAVSTAQWEDLVRKVKDPERDLNVTESVPRCRGLMEGIWGRASVATGALEYWVTHQLVGHHIRPSEVKLLQMTDGRFYLFQKPTIISVIGAPSAVKPEEQPVESSFHYLMKQWAINSKYLITSLSLYYHPLIRHLGITEVWKKDPPSVLIEEDCTTRKRVSGLETLGNIFMERETAVGKELIPEALMDRKEDLIEEQEVTEEYVEVEVPTGLLAVFEVSEVVAADLLLIEGEEVHPECGEEEGQEGDWDLPDSPAEEVRFVEAPEVLDPICWEVLPLEGEGYSP